MRYLAISGEDSSTYLLVCDKSCFVHSKSVHVLLAQARPAMINHHTSKLLVLMSFEVATVTSMDSQEPACCDDGHLLAS